MGETDIIMNGRTWLRIVHEYTYNYYYILVFCSKPSMYFYTDLVYMFLGCSRNLTVSPSFNILGQFMSLI